MENKLEFKHVAPYLPYKLTSKLGVYDEVLEIHGFADDGAGVYLKHHSLTLNGESDIENYKLILRPLSDLTKIIKYEQGRYCIMDCWYSIDVHEADEFTTYGTIPEYWNVVINNIEKNGFNWVDYGFVQLLFKNHFDVFGLIEKGLAIDINTLNK